MKKMNKETEFELKDYKIHNPPKPMPIRYTLSRWGIFVDGIRGKAYFWHRQTCIRVPYTEKKFKKFVYLLCGEVKVLIYKIKDRICLKNGKV
jgi:hypothetical protein